MTFCNSLCHRGRARYRRCPLTEKIRHCSVFAGNPGFHQWSSPATPPCRSLAVRQIRIRARASDEALRRSVDISLINHRVASQYPVDYVDNALKDFQWFESVLSMLHSWAYICDADVAIHNICNIVQHKAAIFDLSRSPEVRA